MKSQKPLTIDDMKRNESKMFYDTYARPMKPIGYSLDEVLERELQDFRNNTKFTQAPCWRAEQVKLSEISEGVSEYQIEMALKMTQMAMAFEGLEMTEKDMNSLKAKYYSNI